MAQLNGKELLLAGLKGETGPSGAPLFVSSASEDQNGTRLIVETAFQSITPKAGNYVLYSGEAKASLSTGNVYKVESLDIGGEGEIVCVVDPASPLGNIRGPEGESGNDGEAGAQGPQGDPGRTLWPVKWAGGHWSIILTKDEEGPKSGDFMFSTDSTQNPGDVFKVGNVSSNGIGGSDQVQFRLMADGTSIGTIRGPQGDPGEPGAQGASIWVGEVMTFGSDERSLYVDATGMDAGPKVGDYVIQQNKAGVPYVNDVGDVLLITEVDDLNAPRYSVKTGPTPAFSIKGPQGEKGDPGEAPDAYTKSETDGLLAEKVSVLPNDNPSDGRFLYELQYSSERGMCDVGLKNLDDLASAEDLAGKLDIPENSGAVRLVGINADGKTTSTWSFGKSAYAGAIPQYDVGGALIVGEPTAGGHAVSKDYAEGLLAGKLEKPANPTKNSSVYIGPDGYVGTIAFDKYAYPNTLAQRTAEGTLRGSDPVDNTDLVNKQYAEANFEAKKAKRKVYVRPLQGNNATAINDREEPWNELAVFGSRPSADCLNSYSGSRIKPSHLKTVKALKKTYLGKIQTFDGRVSAKQIVAFLLGVPEADVGEIKPSKIGKQDTGCGEFTVSKNVQAIVDASPVFGGVRKGWRKGSWINFVGSGGEYTAVRMQGGIFNFAIDNVGRDEIDVNDGRTIQLYRNTIIASLKISLWGSYESEDQSNWIVRSEVLL